MQILRRPEGPGSDWRMVRHSAANCSRLVMLVSFGRILAAHYNTLPGSAGADTRKLRLRDRRRGQRRVPARQPPVERSGDAGTAPRGGGGGRLLLGFGGGGAP